MCLLINQKAGHVFSDDWLADFYSHNPDGIGVMWAADNVINIAKTVPNTLEDLIEFYQTHIAGKECSLHFRWRTHGDTDLTNCHPYEVLTEEDGYPIYLMHNGVLSTGNRDDTTKSDTWHYIKNLIRPALINHPAGFIEPWFKTFIEDHIGVSNKFVMMDAYGNTVTFNESAGVEWEGNWMSNTYAWDAFKAGAKKPAYVYGGYQGYRTADPWDSYLGYEKTGIGNVPAVIPEKKPEPLKAVATSYEHADAWDYADLFLETCMDLGMDYAYTNLPLFTIKAFYINDRHAALDYLDRLERGEVTEAEVMMQFMDTDEDDLLGAEGFVVTEGHLAVGMS